MRLIDADELEEKLYDNMRKYDVYDSCETKIISGIMEAQDLIDDAPTIDAMEVIRCKDCKSIGREIAPGKHACEKYMLPYCRENDFCSCGERKEQ